MSLLFSLAMTFPAVDHVTVLFVEHSVSSSVQGGRALGSLFSDFFGEFLQCRCASTCDTGGSLLTWIGSQAKLAHGGKGMVAAQLVL